MRFAFALPDALLLRDSVGNFMYVDISPGLFISMRSL